MLLSGLLWKNMTAYLDDGCLFTLTFDEHLVLLENLLERLRAANLCLGLKKCEFVMNSVKILGFHVGKEGIKLDSDKVKAIVNMKPPTKVKELDRLSVQRSISGHSSRTSVKS